jgi:hypothetical protein
VTRSNRGAAASAPRITVSAALCGDEAQRLQETLSPEAYAAAPALKEPLIKSAADCVAGKMRMAARRATKVVARTTKPRSATTQTPHFAATRRDGAFRAVCFVARLAKGSGHWLHLASRIPSRKGAVAIARDLIRGSISFADRVAAAHRLITSTRHRTAPAGTVFLLAG